MRKFWEVLIVDDEPDVHAVTRLVLRSTKIYGIPVNVSAASSGAEAKELLSRWRINDEGSSDLAVALIDVVMESDTAGLDLCRFIRGDLHNSMTQLFVRTGQAGKAPERAVIDQYDISGYVTKIEATEDRLYTMVKSGVRQYLSLRVAVGMSRLINGTVAGFVANGCTASALYEALPGLLGRRILSADGDRLPAMDPQHLALIIGNRVAGIGDLQDAQVALTMRDSLRDAPVSLSGPNGETCREEAGQVLLSLPGGDHSIDMVARSSMSSLPDFAVFSQFAWMQTIRHLLSISRS